tara:strand:- start:3015 stop:3338 length:324 start_codon:yes stop_codon:yes gene_type:complete
MNIKRLVDIVKCKKSNYRFRNYKHVMLEHNKQMSINEQMQNIRLRMKVYKQSTKLKSFLNIMLAALIQLYIDAMQSLNLIDKTAHKPAEALLWAEIEPEAIPYISFL